MLLPLALGNPQLCVKFHHHELRWCMQSNDRKCTQKGFEGVAAVIVFITLTRQWWKLPLSNNVAAVYSLESSDFKCQQNFLTLQGKGEYSHTGLCKPTADCYWSLLLYWLVKVQGGSLRQQVNGFLYRHRYSISRECTLKETKYWNIYINSLLLVFLVTRTVCCTPFTPSHIYFTTSHFWKPCCYNVEASVSFSSVQYRVSPRKLVSRGVLSKCLSYINIIR